VRSVIFTGLGIVLGAYVVAIGLLAVMQRRLIYQPDTNRPEPSAYGVPAVQSLSVRAPDGIELLAWFVPPERAAGPVVLYLHGNGGNIGMRARRLVRMHGFGWGVLLLEYRGYGGNAGSPTEIGLLEDARAGYAALREMGFSGQQILIWGESLGSGVGVRLATERDVGAVLLESPYTSIVDVGRRHFPWLPVGLLVRDRFDVLTRIGAVHAPVLVMAGGEDTLVPPDMSRAVFAAAPEPKQYWLASGAGHNDLGEAGALEVAKAFVDRYRAPPP
jgi:fermentation-respiration switch protein FrsA (DUF1100 family)